MTGIFRFSSVAVVALFAWTALAGCSARHHRYPYYVSSRADPGKKLWPKLLLQGNDPRKMAMVRNELVRQGWDSRRIVMDASRASPQGEPRPSSIVKAVVDEGDMDIPVGEAGLDSVARGAVQGIAASYRPWSSGEDCLIRLPAGSGTFFKGKKAVLAELELGDHWRYGYGVPADGEMVLSRCVESIERLEPVQLPWEGPWTLVLDANATGAFPRGGKPARLWFRMVQPRVTVKPLKIIRSKPGESGRSRKAAP